MDGGTLVICPTPLGNLGDVTDRMRAALSTADAIAAEDTRTARRLLGALEIAAPELISYREHNHAAGADEILQRLEQGQTVVLTSDAGMPAVSDPGSRLVGAAAAAGFTVTALPGPSAVPMAIALSGMSEPRFTFVGFFPRKQGELLRVLRDTGVDSLVVGFESPRRLAALLAAVASEWPDRSVVVCRELSKLHEEVVRGTAAELAQQYAAGAAPKGEVTVVVGPTPVSEAAAGLPAAAVRLAGQIADEGVGVRTACKLVAGTFDVSTRELYAAVVER